MDKVGEEILARWAAFLGWSNSPYGGGCKEDLSACQDL